MGWFCDFCIVSPSPVAKEDAFFYASNLQWHRESSPVPRVLTPGRHSESGVNRKAWQLLEMGPRPRRQFQMMGATSHRSYQQVAGCMAGL